MNKITKRIITTFLVALLAFTSIPYDVFAEEIIVDNELENLTSESEIESESYDEIEISEEASEDNVSPEESETEECALEVIDETTATVESEEIIDNQDTDDIVLCDEAPDMTGKFYFKDMSYLCYFEITGATVTEDHKYYNSAIYSIDDSIDKVKIKINARISEYDGSYCNPKLYEFDEDKAVYEDYVKSIGFDEKTRTIEKIYEIDSSIISTKEFYLDDNEDYECDTALTIDFDDNGLVESVTCRVVGGPGTEKTINRSDESKTYAYVKGAHVEIIPTLKSTDAYRLKDILVNDVSVEQFSSKGVIEISETDNSTIKYESEKVYEAYIKASTETVNPINNKYYIESDGNYSIELYNGDSPVSLALSDATALINKKAAPEGFITLKQVGEDPNFINVINIDPSCIDFGKSKTANASIKLTYKEADTEVFNKTFDFVITKKAIPTGYTIKGVKNNIINIEVGDYFYSDVIFNESCDLTKISLKPVGTELYSKVTYSFYSNNINVNASYNNTYKPGTDKYAFFYNDGSDDGIQIGEPFTVNVVSKAIEKATPNVSIAKTSNYSFVFDKKDIKGINYSNSYSTYYHVNAKAVGEINNKFKSEIDYYFRYNQEYETFELKVANEADLSESDMQQYDITIRLERFDSNNDLETVDNIRKPKEGKTPNAVSKYKIFKKQSTKPLAYESKLTLKKGKTTVYPGESDYVDFYIATAVFSKNTSVCELDLEKSYLIDAAGRKFKNVFKKDLTGLKIGLNDYSIRDEITPGKAYAHIFPKVPDSITAKDAVLTLTYKKPIYDIEVSGSSTITKIPGKAASVNYKVNYLDINGNPDTGITKKVFWEIYNAAPEIAKYVSIKNGKVTISKEFVPSKDPSKNTFMIYIGANDFEGHEDYVSNYLEVTVTAQEPVIKQGIIREYEGWELDEPLKNYSPGRIIAIKDDEINPESIIQKWPGEGPKAKRYLARLVDENGDDIEDGVTWKSSSKAIKINENGEITEVNGFGKVTLTATLNQGKKTTYKFNFTIKEKKVSKPQITFYDINDNEMAINDYAVDNYGKRQFTVIVGKTYNTYLGQELAAPVPVITDYKVSISGAKTIEKETYNSVCEYMLEPTAASTLIKITKGKTVTTYTVNNTSFEKSKAKFNKKTLDAYVGSNTPVQREVMLSGYDFKEATADGSYEYSILPYIDLSHYYKLDYDLYMNASEYIFGITPGSEPYSFTPGETIKLNISGKEIQSAQTLKFNVFIIERFIEKGTSNSNVTRETAVPLSIKFVNPKTPKLTLGKPVIDMKGGNRATTLIGKATNGGICAPNIAKGSKVSNAVINGKVNKFTNYFDVTVNEDSTLKITLKDGINPKDIDKNDYIGFVPMTLKNAAGFYVRNDGTASDKDDPYKYTDLIHWMQITVSLKNVPKN